MDELKNCIKYLELSDSFYKYNLVIVYHSEITHISNYINNLYFDNLHKLPVSGTNKSSIENINFNRVLGYNYCFNILNSNYVIAIEDDIIVGYDTLIFSDYIYNIYKNNKSFRGINLCSKNSFEQNKNPFFGKFRYGLSGQCSLITRVTWSAILKKGILFHSNSIGFDSQVESFMKTGFMIHPYNSRYIDNGWNGTHAPRCKFDDYFISLKKSWVGSSRFTVPIYYEKKFIINWRSDCIPYNRLSNFLYKIKFLLNKYLLNE